MSKFAVFLLTFACLSRAEVHPMTLKQAVETALKQNPDITLARLDEEKLRQGVRVAKDPFTPRLIIGSGLAYSNGFPMSIEGSAPSVVQAHIVEDIFNRQQSLAIAQAKEDARGAALATTGKRDEIVFRSASLYLDAERAGRLLDLAHKQSESLQRVLDTVKTQVGEGRALPLAEKQATASLAHARQAAENLVDDAAAAETSLALALGFSAEDRVHPVSEQRSAPVLPASEEEAVQAALDANKDLRRLESQITSKQLEMRGVKAQRLPHVDLVAQTQSDISHLKVELSNSRNHLRSDLQQSFRDVHKAETSVEVARLDLDVAREQLSVLLAQMQEGRANLSQVEQARISENEKWMAFYDAQYSMERARWSVLKLTGTLLAAVETQ